MWLFEERHNALFRLAVALEALHATSAVHGCVTLGDVQLNETDGPVRTRFECTRVVVKGEVVELQEPDEVEDVYWEQDSRMAAAVDVFETVMGEIVIGRRVTIEHARHMHAGNVLSLPGDPRWIALVHADGVLGSGCLELEREQKTSKSGRRGTDSGRVQKCARTSSGRGAHRVIRDGLVRTCMRCGRKGDAVA
jgi:hypothetical protein